MNSSSDAVVAFLPCRKGSERAPRKNIRPFGPFQHGLVEIKLAQLLSCPAIERVLLSTNDEEILEYATSLSSAKITIHNRDNSLSSNTTSTDELVSHACDLVGSGHILWTHVTSPFVGSGFYSSIIAAYRKALTNGFDSLMTTTPLRAFLWNDNGPINYCRKTEKWPRTQMLEALYEVNSAVFLASVQIYTECHDRIGKAPMLYPLDRLSSMDIDWEEDFALAEQILISGLRAA
jgi:CMP-N-acetylneuraminic acid synthetase